MLNLIEVKIIKFTCCCITNIINSDAHVNGNVGIVITCSMHCVGNFVAVVINWNCPELSEQYYCED